jgi:hypothetical protein
MSIFALKHVDLKDILGDQTQHPKELILCSGGIFESRSRNDPIFVWMTLYQRNAHRFPIAQ